MRKGALIVGIAAAVLVCSFGAAWLLDDPTSSSESESSQLVSSIRRLYADAEGQAFAASGLLPAASWQTLEAFGPGTARWQIRQVLKQAASLPELVPDNETLLAFTDRRQVRIVTVQTSVIAFPCITGTNVFPRTARLHVVRTGAGILAVLPEGVRLNSRDQCIGRAAIV